MVMIRRLELVTRPILEVVVSSVAPSVRVGDLVGVVALKSVNRLLAAPIAYLAKCI
jgi:hypothetical protein